MTLAVDGERYPGQGRLTGCRILKFVTLHGYPYGGAPSRKPPQLPLTLIRLWRSTRQKDRSSRGSEAAHRCYTLRLTAFSEPTRGRGRFRALPSWLRRPAGVRPLLPNRSSDHDCIKAPGIWERRLCPGSLGIRLCKQFPCDVGACSGHISIRSTRPTLTSSITNS